MGGDVVAVGNLPAVARTPRRHRASFGGRRRPGAFGAVSTASGPYVGLDYFVEEDAGPFFGREAEQKRIIGNLRASRLTLLYAESGVGKSSLLRAGVSARLHELASRSVVERGSARYFPVVVSAWRGDSKAASIAALERPPRYTRRSSPSVIQTFAGFTCRSRATTRTSWAR